MSFETAYHYLKTHHMEDRVMEFDTSSATVALAAKALGCAPAHIAKTLSFENGESCVLVVAAGDRRIDNRLFKEAFGFKPKMLSPERALALIGHAVGGICPFGVHCPVYLDTSLLDYETVYPACGSSNSAVRLTPEELFALSHAVQWVSVCQNPINNS